MNTLNRLRDLVRARSKVRQLRILVCHHPIRYPLPTPLLGMVLDDQESTCRFLDRGTDGARPLIHLILSGHTHFLSPGILTFPESFAGADQPPLGRHQCQITVGSLSQVDPDGVRGDFPQQCQIVRFYYDKGERNLLWIQRLLAVRTAGRGASAGASIGEFKVHPDSNRSICFEL